MSGQRIDQTFKYILPNYFPFLEGHRVGIMVDANVRNFGLWQTNPTKYFLGYIRSQCAWSVNK